MSIEWPSLQMQISSGRTIVRRFDMDILAKSNVFFDHVRLPNFKLITIKKLEKFFFSTRIFAIREDNEGFAFGEIWDAGKNARDRFPTGASLSFHAGTELCGNLKILGTVYRWK